MMNFDELQSDWDCQETPFYIDDENLTSFIMTEAKRVSRNLNFFEYGFISITGLMSLFFLGEIFIGENVWVAGISSSVLLAMTWILIRERKARRKHRIDFNDSMISIVRTALNVVRYQIRRNWSMMFWFVAPTVSVMALQLAQSGSTSILKWLFPILSVPFMYFVIARNVKSRLIPQKKTLETILLNINKTEDQK